MEGRTRTSQARSAPPHERHADSELGGDACSERSPADHTSPRTDLFFRDPHRYHLLAEHGRGGIGRVMRAKDRELDRVIAVKELKAHGYQAEIRFVREAMITARLQHPGIVPVHEAGRWPDGRPFYAMKLVEGRTLKALIESCKTLAQRIRLVPHVSAVADAVAYAHSRGVVHRDLKPSNIVVGDYGETVVIDWGLAKSLEDLEDVLPAPGPYRSPGLSDLTSTGSVLGTPAYMPPEQAFGRPVDARADVYALGAILYHVLGGRRPYADDTGQDVLQAVRRSPPPPLQDVSPGVPSDLRAIVTKAMARDPDDRYETASAFRADLRSFESGRLVAAHAYTLRERAARWHARHRALVAVACVALIALTAIALYSIRRIIDERNDAVAERGRAEQASAEAQRSRNAVVLSQAESTASVDPTKALRLLSTYDGENRLEQRELALLAVARGVALGVTQAHLDTIKHVRILGDTVFTSGDDGRLVRRSLHDVQHGEILQTLVAPFPGFDVTSTGALATADYDGQVRFTRANSATSEIVTRHSHRIRVLKLSIDGRLLASADESGQLHVFTTDRAEQHDLHCTGRPIAMDFTAKGSRLAVVTDAASICVYDTTSEQPSTLFTATGTAIAWLGKTDELIIARTDGSVELRNGRKSKVVLSQTKAISVASSESGRWLAAATDAQIVLVDLNATRQVRVSARATSPLTFSPDEATLAVGTENGEMLLVHLPSGETSRLLGHRYRIDAAPSFSTDSRILATGDANGELRVWRVDPPKCRGRDLLQGPATFAPLSSDGATLLVSGYSDSIVSWDLDSDETNSFSEFPVPVYRGVKLGARRFAFIDGRHRVVLLENGVPIQLRDNLHGNTVLELTVSDSGSYLATASLDGLVRVWDLSKRAAPPMVFATGKIAKDVAFSPDGRHLFAVGMETGVHELDLATGTHTYHPSEDAYHALAFTRAGQLAAANDNNSVDWLTGPSLSVESRIEVDDVIIDLVSYGDSVVATFSQPILRSLSPDGSVVGWPVDTRALTSASTQRYLATGHSRGTIRVADAQTGRVVLLPASRSPISSLHFSEDGSRLSWADELGRAGICTLPEHGTWAPPNAALSTWIAERLPAQ